MNKALNKTRVCNACGETLPLRKFEGRGGGQRRATCRRCRKGNTPTKSVAEVKADAERASTEAHLRRLIAGLTKEVRMYEARERAVLGLANARSARVLFRRKSRTRWGAAAVALVSDWHVDEIVRAASVQGLNEYSPEIARQRAERFFVNLVRLITIIQRDVMLEIMFLKLLGDFFTGYIHEENLANTAMGPADAAQHAFSLLSAGIAFLLKETNVTLRGKWIAGNHGRLTKKVWSSDVSGTSIEAFMYRALVSKFEGHKRFQCTLAPSPIVTEEVVPGYPVRFLHGYEVNYGGGVGGISIPANKAIAQWDKSIPARWTCMGHWHQRHHGGRLSLNGSLIGYSAYSQRIKADFNPPEQSFFVVHEDGRQGIAAPIWVDK